MRPPPGGRRRHSQQQERRPGGPGARPDPGRAGNRGLSSIAKTWWGPGAGPSGAEHALCTGQASPGTLWSSGLCGDLPTVVTRGWIVSALCPPGSLVLSFQWI